MSHKQTPSPSYPLIAALALALAGCAGQALHQQGMDLIAHGRLEEGLSKLHQASSEAPDNQTYRLAYFNSRQRVVGRWLADAQRERKADNLDTAESIYRRVLAIDPVNAEALAGIGAIDRGRQHVAMLQEAQSLLAANDVAGARARVEEVLRDNPRLRAALALRTEVENRVARDEWLPPPLRRSFQKPVSLEFRDAPLKQVLEALSRYSGLNFVLDKDVPPTLTVSVFLNKVSISDALDVMLSTNALRRRVLNDTTLLIYPDTAAKAGEHQDLVVRNIYLAHGEAKQVATILTGMLKAKNVYVNEKLNMLTIRDTPDMIDLAERLIASQDVAEPEVMLEVAIVEITRSQLSNLGIQYPDQLSLTPLAAGEAGLTLYELLNLNSRRIGAAISPLTINLQDESTATNLLANPSLRTHNREKASIRIGDRVPVITTTATSTGFLSENVQYVDVGLKLEVEPVIFPNDEISIRLGLEVSSIVREIATQAGSVSYQLGARTASTVLRLRDGETQILGGLINDDDRRNANRFPGLGALPMLSALFGSRSNNNQKTELVLSITPRVLRSLSAETLAPGRFWSGTEAAPRIGSPRLSNRPPAAAPASATAPALPAPTPYPQPGASSSQAPGAASPPELMTTTP